MFFSKTGVISVQKQRSMVEMSQKKGHMKYYLSHVILKINRKIKYPKEEEWVTHQLNFHWNTGIPISMDYLMQLLQKHVVSGKVFDAMLKS